MKAGDLVTYGVWYRGKERIGMLVEADAHENWFVMWVNHEDEWENEDDLEVINERR
jgi:hypothetical protein